MVAFLTTTQGMLQTLSQVQVQTSEKSSKSFKKIPALYQNMILVASSIGQTVPSKLEDSARWSSLASQTPKRSQGRTDTSLAFNKKDT